MPPGRGIATAAPSLDRTVHGLWLPQRPPVVIVGQGLLHDQVLAKDKGPQA